MRQFDKEFPAVTPPIRSMVHRVLEAPGNIGTEQHRTIRTIKEPHTIYTLNHLADRARELAPTVFTGAQDKMLSRGNPRGEMVALNPPPVWVRAGQGDHFVKVHLPNATTDNYDAVLRRLRDLGSQELPRVEPHFSMWFPVSDSIPRNESRLMNPRGGFGYGGQPYNVPFASYIDRETGEQTWGADDHWGVAVMREGNRALLTAPLNPAVTTSNSVGVLGIPKNGITPQMADQLWGENRVYNPYEDDEGYTDYDEGEEPEPSRILQAVLHETAVPLSTIKMAGDFEDRRTKHPLVLAHAPRHTFQPTPEKTWFYSNGAGRPEIVSIGLDRTAESFEDNQEYQDAPEWERREMLQSATPVIDRYATHRYPGPRKMWWK